MIRYVWLCLFVYAAHFGFAQITSGDITGKVVDEQGVGIPGANVRLILETQGTERLSITTTTGAFHFYGQKPGGPYQLVVTYVGLVQREIPAFFLQIGEQKEVQIHMISNAEILEGVEIVAQKEAGINSDKIITTPTIDRKLQDVTRLNPYNNGNSFAGTNFRFNSLNIDGAATNDIVGFQEPASGAGGAVAAGTPGALAKVQPISLDVIDQIQVEVSPFDVRQGNFNGAVINATTKSGSNTPSGSVYFLGRNQHSTGKSLAEPRTKLAAFHHALSGVSFSAPIRKNELFVFANFETTTQAIPVLNAAGDPGVFVDQPTIDQLVDTLQQRYGYDPGSTRGETNEVASNKLFVRLDWVKGNHTLALRNNFVSGFADQLERTATDFKFGSQGFRHQSKTNSSVVEWNWYAPSGWHKKTLVGFNTVEENRTFDGDVFPHVQINHNSSGTIYLGTYREASIYGTSIQSINIQNHWSKTWKNHRVLLGTSNELHQLKYYFLTAWNGRWEYRSLEDFYAHRPKRIRGVYNLQDNSYDHNRNTPSAALGFGLLSFFAQDQITFNDQWSLGVGIRIDGEVFDRSFPVNDEVIQTPEFARFKRTKTNQWNINPRMQLGWDEGNWKLQMGSGLYSGRIPFVWYAYAHYISGNRYGNIDLKPSDEQELEEDLSTLRSQQDGIAEINLVDPDFQLPRIWRSEFQWSYSFSESLTLRGSVLWSNYLQSILFQNINLGDSISNFTGNGDQRSYYTASGENNRQNANFTSVFLLTNTQQGSGVSMNIGLDALLWHFPITLDYTYGQSRDVSNGVRNSMAANFNWNQSVQSNSPELAYSNFDIRHRVLSTLTREKKWRTGGTTRFTLLVQTQSGSPFSFTYNGDVNNDNSSKNDLIFVPKDPSQIDLVDIKDDQGNITRSAEEQWQALDQYINDSDYLRARRGKYAERNGARTPWNSRMDLSVSHRIPWGKTFFEFGVNVLNVGNALHKAWGRQYFVPNITNASYQLIDFESRENGRPQYTFHTQPDTPWQVDPLLSRWQAQLQIRLTF